MLVTAEIGDRLCQRGERLPMRRADVHCGAQGVAQPLRSSPELYLRATCNHFIQRRLSTSHLLQHYLCIILPPTSKGSASIAPDSAMSEETPLDGQAEAVKSPVKLSPGALEALVRQSRTAKATRLLTTIGYTDSRNTRRHRLQHHPQHCDFMSPL